MIRDSLDEDVAAAVGLDEAVAQVVAGAEDALLDGHAALGHLAQAADVFVRARTLTVRAAPRPAPPVLVRRRAVERAAPRHRDVLLLEGVDERRVVHALRPLEARVDDGQVLRRVGAELERRAFGDVEVDVALQMNRAGEERARGHDHATAARRVRRRDGLADGVGVVRPAVAARAVVGDGEIARGETGRPDAREYRGHGLPPDGARDVPRRARRAPLRRGGVKRKRGREQREEDDEEGRVMNESVRGRRSHLLSLWLCLLDQKPCAYPSTLMVSVGAGLVPARRYIVIQARIR